MFYVLCTKTLTQITKWSPLYVMHLNGICDHTVLLKSLLLYYTYKYIKQAGIDLAYMSTELAQSTLHVCILKVP